MTIKFIDCLKFNNRGNDVMASEQVPNFVQAAAAKGNVIWLTKGSTKLEVKGSAELQALQEAMRQAGASSSREDHEMIGAAAREPIRLLARYKEWTQFFYAPMSLGMTEDNAIPTDQPIGSAFISSPEGRVNFIRPGVQQWYRPGFYEIKAGLSVLWRTLQTASWAILQRRMEETADAIAYKRDVLGKAVMDTAIAATSGHTSTVATSLTKSTLDAVIAAAVQIGFPITQMAINPGRLVDMSSWTFGSTSAIPYSFAPEGVRQQFYDKLFAEGYGGLRYIISHNVPMASIYLSGDPSETGYKQDHGQARSMSDVNIHDMADEHIIYEDIAHYVGNAYNLWKITIT